MMAQRRSLVFNDNNFSENKVILAPQTQYMINQTRHPYQRRFLFLYMLFMLSSIFLTPSYLNVAAASAAAQITAFDGNLIADSTAIKYENACTDTDIYLPDDIDDNSPIHYSSVIPTPTTLLPNGQIKFPQNFDIYSRNTPYKCKWNFHTTKTRNGKTPVDDNIKIRITFSKFRLDQRCKNHPHIYDPEVTTNFSSCRLLSYYANKFNLDSVNRVILSNIHVPGPTVSKNNVGKNVMADPNAITDVFEPKIIRENEQEIGCLCGMSDDERYVELSDSLKSELYSQDYGADGKVSSPDRDIDRNSIVHWFVNTYPTDSKSGGLSVQILVPHPFLGVGFTLHYEYIRLENCGGNLPIFVPWYDAPLKMFKTVDFIGGFIKFDHHYDHEDDVRNNDVGNDNAINASGWKRGKPGELSTRKNDMLKSSPRFGPLLCIWNLTFPSTYHPARPTGSTWNKEETSLNADWRLLLNFTHFGIGGDDEMIGSYMYITNPGIPSPISAFPLLRGGALSDVPQRNKRPRDILTSGSDSLLLLESSSNSFIIKMIISPLSKIPSFKLRWTPFIHLKDNETECPNFAVPCVVDEEKNFNHNTTKTFGHNEGLTPSFINLNTTTSNITTMTNLTEMDNDLNSFLTNKFCVPRELLCNGYVECPNSMLDESPNYCLSQFLLPSEPPAENSEIRLEATAPNKLKYPPHVTKYIDNSMVEINEMPETGGNASSSTVIAATEAQIGQQQRPKLKKLSLWILIGIPIGLVLLLIPFLLITIKKCFGHRKNRYEIANTSCKMEMNGHTSNGFGDDDQEHSKQIRGGIQNGVINDISNTGKLRNGHYGNGNANFGNQKPTSQLLVRGTGMESTSRNSSYRLPDAANGLEEETLLATGITKPGDKSFDDYEDSYNNNNNNQQQVATTHKNQNYSNGINSNVNRHRETEEIEKTQTLFLPEERIKLLNNQTSSVATPINKSPYHRTTLHTAI